MCGRYALTTPPEQIATLFEVTGALPRDRAVGAWRARYNIAPTQMVAVVRAAAAAPTSSGQHVGGTMRELEMMRWGLVPRWATSADKGPAPIDARSETAAQKPAFRQAMRQSGGGGRCLLPCDGFYEWKKLDGKAKQPMFVRLQSGGTFALAGLWERWRPKAGGDELQSCTILTTAPNGLMKPIHDRMPVIVALARWGEWLDPAITELERVADVLRPYPAAEMETYPVGRGVNRPGNEGAGLIERVEAPAAEREGEAGLWG